jgi:hypothetical protein
MPHEAMHDEGHMHMTNRAIAATIMLRGSDPTFLAAQKKGFRPSNLRVATKRLYAPGKAIRTRKKRDAL